MKKTVIGAVHMGGNAEQAVQEMRLAGVTVAEVVGA